MVALIIVVLMIVNNNINKYVVDLEMGHENLS